MTSSLAEPAPDRPRVRGPLLRLLFSILGANLGVFFLWGAIPGILLPLQIQAFGEGQKAQNLALVLAVGAVVALIAQPLAGMVSDRTRSRFGRRSPWMIIGALVGGMGLIGIASASTLVQIVISWCVVQLAYNFSQGPLSAVMPDRVPGPVRGLFSAFTGLGVMAGMAGGQVIASGFADSVPAGYLFFAGVALVVLVAFVLLNPDRDNRGEPREPFDAKTFFHTFWVNPVKHPDFFWGFSGRMLLNVGTNLVVGYQLYILQDYIGLGGEAIRLVPLLAVINLVATTLAVLISGPLSDRLGRRRIFVVIAGIGMAVGFSVPWIAPSITGVLIYAALGGFFSGVFQAVDTALMSEVLPSTTSFAKDLGVLNIAATLPQTFGPALAGFIVVFFGGYVMLFPIAIVLVVLGAIAVIPIRSVR
ncbi:MFS transporter [Mycetocola saprophilus]|uniref:MFS transporter n=1 Tax=Mycetocola saprophilus TaxID=76636 RepID=UPI003BF15AAC